MNGDTVLTGFCGYLARVRGLANASVEAYERDVAGFLAHARAREWPLRAAVSRLRVGAYLMARTEKRLRDESEPPRLTTRSAARLISALKAFAQYLQFAGELKENPLAGFKAPKYARQLPPYFSSDEMRLVVCIYDDAPSDEPLQIRNAALLHLLYATGMRVSECAVLTLDAIEHNARLVQVMGKGGKQRIVPYGAYAELALARYLREGRPALASESSDQALWLNHRGRRLSRRGISHVLAQTIKHAALLKQISPHKLRHACATHLIEGGASVRLVQELLGHESLNTTQVYTRITRAHLREVYEQTHPRAGSKAE